MERPHPSRDRALELRAQGLKYKEIAEIMGVSHQYVAQVCGKSNPYRFRYASEKIVYPNLRKWLNDNKVSIREFIRRCGSNPYGGTLAIFNNWLYGNNDPCKRHIDASLKVTGMTYEELFYREG